MIEVFKILHYRYYDSEVAPKLTLNNASVTRGNSLKLFNQSFHYGLRKYSFPARVVNIWNSLPNVVIHAEHVVHRRGYCFDFGCMFVCLYVC